MKIKNSVAWSVFRPFRSAVCAVFAVCLSSFMASVQAQCVEFTPNPNPIGNTIVNTSSDRCTEDTLNNFGRLENYGYLENFGTVNNYGSVVNYSQVRYQTGVLNNYGELLNHGTQMEAHGLNNSADGVLTNVGTILGTNAKNYGRVENYGALRGSIENYGTINNNLGATQTVVEVLNLGTLRNDGVLANTGQLENYGTLNNNGALSNDGYGMFNWAGGTLNNNVGATLSNDNGRMDNYGTLNNSGSLSTASGPLYNHSGGMLNNYGTVENGYSVANDGHLINSSSGSFNAVLTNRGLAENFGTMNSYAVNNGDALYSGYILNNSGTINTREFENNRYAEFNNSGTLTVQDFMANSGRFSITTGGVVTGSGIFRSEGGATIVDGSISLASVDIYRGVVQGTGTISGLVFVNGGTLAPGNSVGTLTINGDLAFNSGTLEIEIGSSGFDLLNISGTTSFLAGTIAFSFLNGFLPHLGDQWLFLSSGGGVTGWENLNLSYLGAEGYSFALTESGGGLMLSVVGGGVAPVPEPETYAMMLAGLGLLGVMARRRKQKDVPYC